MKDEAIQTLQKRVRRLEWRLHLLCAAVVLLVCFVTGVLSLPSVTAQESTTAIIRTRGLMILDEQGVSAYSSVPRCRIRKRALAGARQRVS
jgi:hypothetical protein